MLSLFRGIPSDIRRRINRGAAKLDKARPDWHKRVSLRRLNIGSPQDCMLGQEYGHYSTGRLVLLGTPETTLELEGKAIRLGFQAAQGVREDKWEYELLTAGWKQLVWRRRLRSLWAF